MNDLRITEFFTSDELDGIYNAAHAEYEVDFKDEKGEGKELYLLLLFADYTHAAYLLRQSKEYMQAYNDFKEICESRGNTSFLRIWEGMCINMALHNPELKVGEVVAACCARICELMVKHFPDVAKD